MQQGQFVRVFVASPSDVAAERVEACQVIQEWNAAHSLSRSILIEPVRVETHVRAVQGGHPQDLINGQLLKRCDILLAIFWARLGTPTVKDVSGTVQEIREFSELRGENHVLLFFCNRDLPFNFDRAQLEAVNKFQKDIQGQGVYIQYGSVEEFARVFRHQLDMTLNSLLESEEAQTTTASPQPKVLLEPESCTLLAVGALAPHSNIIVVSTLSGTEVFAHDVNFANIESSRSQAKWIDAVKQLEQLSLIADEGANGEVFRLTNRGYRTADHLWHLLILRRIKQMEKHDGDYVDLTKIASEKLLGLELPPYFILEKALELQKQNAVDCVNFSGEIGACSLASGGKKTLRENGTVQFAEPDL